MEIVRGKLTFDLFVIFDMSVAIETLKFIEGFFSLRIYKHDIYKMTTINFASKILYSVAYIRSFFDDLKSFTCQQQCD